MSLDDSEPQEWPEHIQVITRIRPINRREVESEKDILVATDRSQTKIRAQILNEEKTVSCDKEFLFDAHYGPMSTQSEIYQRPAALVESVLNGCNATIFAYGQTGAGKSHTMFGPDDLPGVLPRAGKQIFDRMSEFQNNEQSNAVPTRLYSVQCSFLQIYNECVTDLLVSPEEIRANRRSSSDLRIKECRQAGLYVNGLSWVDVTSADEFLDTYKTGQHNQLTAATMMSSASSRITSVFTAVVTCKSLSEGEGSSTCGKLTIVEMAGSERQQKMGLQGLRLSESCKIGLSISAFGNVIEALTNERKHVPYRDSKLTRLLQSSFGGNTRTLMIACINPTEGQESLSTLRHAARIMKIQNKFHVNTSPVVTTVPPVDPVLSAALDPLPPCLPAPVATTVVAPTPPVVVKPPTPDPLEHLLKRIALLEKMIAVCVPDEALVAKLEASAVWNDDKRDWSIPVHYAAKVLSHVNQADVVDVCGTHGVCDEETDWVVVDENK